MMRQKGVGLGPKQFTAAHRHPCLFLLSALKFLSRADLRRLDPPRTFKADKGDKEGCRQISLTPLPYGGGIPIALESPRLFNQVISDGLPVSMVTLA
jgi:hypothetical protein